MRFFPFEEPYDHQQEAMGTIYDALEAGRDVLSRGPRDREDARVAGPRARTRPRTSKTVVITTNVHQQMRQFVEDASAITDQERYERSFSGEVVDVSHRR